MTDPNPVLQDWGLPILAPYRPDAVKVLGIHLSENPQYGGNETYLGDELELRISYEDTSGERNGWAAWGDDAFTHLTALLKAAGLAT